MWDWISDINNTALKKIKMWNNRSEGYIGNTMGYVVKSYEFKTTIVECTKERLKGTTFNYPHKGMSMYPMSTWRN